MPVGQLARVEGSVGTAFAGPIPTFSAVPEVSLVIRTFKEGRSSYKELQSLVDS